MKKAIIIAACAMAISACSSQNGVSVTELENSSETPSTTAAAEEIQATLPSTEAEKTLSAASIDTSSDDIIRNAIDLTSPNAKVPAPEASGESVSAWNNGRK